LDDAEFKAFEKTAFSFLKLLGFRPTGYYPYEHCANVSGELAPVPPFTLPLRVIVEIARMIPTRASIEGFLSLSKVPPSQRLILICQHPLSDLASDLQLLIRKSSIEFFDQATMSRELQKRKI